MESEIITLQELYEFKLEQILPDRTVLGELKPTGLRPNFVHKFVKRGIELPQSMFVGNSQPVAEGAKW